MNAFQDVACIGLHDAATGVRFIAFTWNLTDSMDTDVSVERLAFLVPSSEAPRFKCRPRYLLS